MTGSICPVPILSRASDKNLPEPVAPSTMAAMLDIRLIREKPDFVRSRVATRGGDDAGKIDQVLAVDAERRKTGRTVSGGWGTTLPARTIEQPSWMSSKELCSCKSRICLTKRCLKGAM